MGVNNDTDYLQKHRSYYRVFVKQTFFMFFFCGRKFAVERTFVLLVWDFMWRYAPKRWIG